MLTDNHSKVLRPTHVKFECLRDKRANLVLLSLAISDVSGIHIGRVWYLPCNRNFLGCLDLAHREFQQELGVLVFIKSSDTPQCH